MKKRNLFKITALTAVFALGSMFANAQTSGTTGPNLEAAAATGTPIKVIDNKGTVKYIQSNNGITSITSTDAGNETRTTFQLGGTLLEDTYIDATGKEFGIKGLDFIPANPTIANTVGGTGYVIMAVDNTTGELRKMFFTDLIQAGRYVNQVSITNTTPGDVSFDTSVSLPAFEKVYVYRNGAKLLADTDYDISGTNVVIHVTADLPLYALDMIEVHYIK